MTVHYPPASKASREVANLIVAFLLLAYVTWLPQDFFVVKCLNISDIIVQAMNIFIPFYSEFIYKNCGPKRDSYHRPHSPIYLNLSDAYMVQATTAGFSDFCYVTLYFNVLMKLYCQHPLKYSHMIIFGGRRRTSL